MTAEEFIKDAQQNPKKGWTARKMLIEFAKYHVKKALEAASKNIDQNKLEWYDYYDFSKGVETVENTSNIEAILEAYPESNIK